MNSFEHYRTKANLTQAQSAAILKADQPSVSKREPGISLPQTEKPADIAKLHGVTVDAPLCEPREEKAAPK